MSNKDKIIRLLEDANERELKIIYQFLARLINSTHACGNNQHLFNSRARVGRD